MRLFRTAESVRLSGGSEDGGRRVEFSNMEVYTVHDPRISPLNTFLICLRCFGDKGDVEDITEGWYSSMLSHDGYCSISVTKSRSSGHYLDRRV